MNEAPIPKPYPEARPPHLPDVLTRQSPWILAFLAIALLQVWQRWNSLAGPGEEDLGMVVGIAMSSIQNIVPPLLGAALFWRHPNARATMPLLVFGLALLAFVELLAVFDQPIRDVLRAIVPPAADELLVLDTPAEMAFRVFTSLLSVFAVLYTGAGLSAARHERSTAERPLAIWLVALAIVGTVVSLAATAQLEFEATPFLIVQLVIGTILSILVTFAWAYLVAVTVGGWMTGEAPHRAWGLAALATTTLFASRLMFTLLTSVPLGDWALTLLQVLGYASLVAWLVLLAAFLLGLPSLPDEKPDEPTVDPQEATLPGSAAG